MDPKGPWGIHPPVFPWAFLKKAITTLIPSLCNQNTMAKNNNGDDAPQTAAALTRDYVERHPSVRDALRMGIVNYSALARIMVQDTDVTSEEAVIAALRRHEDDTSKRTRQDDIIQILQDSRLIMKTKVSIVNIKGSWDSFKSLDGILELLSPGQGGIQVIQGIGGITVILEDDLLNDILSLVREDRLSNVQSGLVQINVVSPQTISETSGVMAYVSDALSTNGINALEVFSCYTDTVIVVSEEDMTEAFNALKRCLAK